MNHEDDSKPRQGSDNYVFLRLTKYNQSKEYIMNFRLFFAAIILLMTSGCATVMSGDTEAVTSDSSPSGADVFIDSGYVGTTPMTIRLRKSKKDTVMFKKEGYQTVSRDLSKSYDPVTIISVFWDLSTTDFLTGAAMEYNPKSYFIELKKLN